MPSAARRRATSLLATPSLAARHQCEWRKSLSVAKYNLAQKHIRSAISVSMAAMNSTAIKWDALTFASAPINSVAITVLPATHTACTDCSPGESDERDWND